MLDVRAITEFINLAIKERDAICSALQSDKLSRDTQQRLAGWHSGKVDGWMPVGDTHRVLDELGPRRGYGDFEQAFQRANADAIDSGIGSHLLPKLEASGVVSQVLGKISDVWRESLSSLFVEVREAAKNDPAFQRLEAERQKMVDQFDADKAGWTAKHGEPYPAELDDYARLAVRAGVDPNHVLSGNWTLVELQPIIDGYLQRLRDAVKIMAVKANIHHPTPEQRVSGERTADEQERTIEELEKETPRLAATSKEWLRVGSPELKAEAVSVDSLRTMRSQGRKTPDGTFGIDKSGRRWRKKSSDSRTVYYWRPSLRSSPRDLDR